MTLLTKLVEIHNETDNAEDIFVCTPCQDETAHTVVPEPETKEGVCEWRFHV